MPFLVAKIQHYIFDCYIDKLIFIQRRFNYTLSYNIDD